MLTCNQSLSSHSVYFLGVAVKDMARNHHFVLSQVAADPVALSAYADGVTGSGRAAAALIHDLGGMAAAW